MTKQGKNFSETKPTKLFVKLPDNYSEMSEEDQKEWRKEVVKAIIEHPTK